MEEKNVPNLDQYLVENNNSISNIIRENVTLTSIESIDKYLLSSDSYENKIKTLNEEKEKVRNLMNYLEYSEDLFKNDKDYLITMESMYNANVESLKKRIPANIALLLGNIGLSFAFSDLINKYGTDILRIVPLSFIIICSHLFFIYNTYYIMYDLVDVIEYKEELSEYKKALTKKD